MNRAPVTAYMVVHNEAHRLDRTLMLLRQYVERIVIVDNESTDDSLKIANRWADEVYPICYLPRTQHRSIAVWKPKPGQWILGIDADEELTSEAGMQLAVMASNPNIDAWGLVRLSRVFYRDHVENVETAAHLRLFRHGSMACTEELHTPPWPVQPERYAVTPFIAMLHDKAFWEQRLDVIEYDQAGVLGDDAANVRRKWGI